MGVRLEDLTPDALISGIVGDRAVTIVAVRWIGSNAVQVTYRNHSGGHHDDSSHCPTAQTRRRYMATCY